MRAMTGAARVPLSVMMHAGGGDLPDTLVALQRPDRDLAAHARERRGVRVGADEGTALGGGLVGTGSAWEHDLVTAGAQARPEGGSQPARPDDPDPHLAAVAADMATRLGSAPAVHNTDRVSV